MAYVPKSQVEQDQIDKQNQDRSVLSYGSNGQSSDVSGGGADTSQLLAAQGNGGAGSQFTNFQDLVDANSGATKNLASTINQSLGIGDAQSSIDKASTDITSNASGGVHTINDDYLQNVLNNPSMASQNSDQYKNLTSILGGSGYTGATSANDFYNDARSKVANAQTAAGLLNDPSGLYAQLQAHPAQGATSGGSALDASLLYGNQDARAMFGQAQKDASDLTGKLTTSQSSSDDAIKAAQAQQTAIADTAKNKIVDTRTGIQNQANAAVSTAEQAADAKQQQLQTAAQNNDYATLQSLLPGIDVSSLKAISDQLKNPTGDLSAYLTNPTSAAPQVSKNTAGTAAAAPQFNWDQYYGTGDVTDANTQAQYNGLGQLIGQNDQFFNTKGGWNPAFDASGAQTNLNSLLTAQQAQDAANAAKPPVDTGGTSPIGTPEQGIGTGTGVSGGADGVSGNTGNNGSNTGGLSGTSGTTYNSDGSYTKGGLTYSADGIGQGPDGSVFIDPTFSFANNPGAASAVSVLAGIAGVPGAATWTIQQLWNWYSGLSNTDKTNLAFEQNRQQEAARKESEQAAKDAADQQAINEASGISTPDYGLSNIGSIGDLGGNADVSGGLAGGSLGNGLGGADAGSIGFDSGIDWGSGGSSSGNDIGFDSGIDWGSGSGGSGETSGGGGDGGGGSSYGTYGGYNGTYTSGSGPHGNDNNLGKGFSDDREQQNGMADGGSVGEFERKNMERGGQVTGPGGPRDDMVPIMASNREFVIPEHVVRALGENFFKKLLKDNPLDAGDQSNIRK